MTETTPEQAAVRTLEHMGYTYHGGRLWKPPIGQKPDLELFDFKVSEIEWLDSEIESLRARVAELEAEVAEAWRCCDAR